MNHVCKGLQDITTTNHTPTNVWNLNFICKQNEMWRACKLTQARIFLKEWAVKRKKKSRKG